VFVLGYGKMTNKRQQQPWAHHFVEVVPKKGTIFPDHVSRSDRRPAVSTVEQKKMNRASRVFCDISTMAVSFSTVKAALHT
jgi:hypothetical protein